MTSALLWKEWYEQRWKLAFGCVLLVGYTATGLSSFAVAALITRGREEPILGILFVYIQMVVLAIVTLIWTTSFGMSGRSEGAVGMVSIAVFVGWFLWLMVLDELKLDKTIREWVWAMHPFVVIEPELVERQIGLLMTCVIQGVIAIILWVWGGRRFVRIGRKVL